MLFDDVGTHVKFTPVNHIFTPILGCSGLTGAPTHYNLYIFVFSVIP